MTARKKREAHKARAARLLELLHDCRTWNEAVERLMAEEEAEAGHRVRNAELSDTAAKREKATAH